MFFIGSQPFSNTFFIRSGPFSIENHSDSAVHTGVISKFREFELCGSAGVESSGHIVFLYRVDQDLTRLGDTSADHDHIGVYHTRDVGKGSSQHFSKLLNQFDSRLISRFCEIKDIFAGHFRKAAELRRFFIVRKSDLCHADDSGSGCILLQAALLAAAAALRLIFIHQDMTDFSARAVSACKDPASDDDSSSDARAECDHDHIAESFSAAEPLFAQCRHIGVVSG